MPVTVRLGEIIEALELQTDQSYSFLDPDTGQVEIASRDLLNEAEAYEDDEEPDLPAWQEPEWEIAKQVVFSGRFEKLPTKFDVHEWEIMQDFSSVRSDRLRDELLGAIHGAGAFRNFKRVIRKHRIEYDWRRFRDEAVKQTLGVEGLSSPAGRA
jgi:hypothetical protein